MDCVDIPFDSVWCPVCSRQIVPKRIHLPAQPAPQPTPAPPASPTAPSKPTQQQDAHPRLTRGKTGTIRPRAAGLVHGTGRVKPNGTIKRSPTKDASATQDSKSDAAPAPSRPAAPVRQRTVIDPSPVPLYCSDECRLMDLQATHSALDINYNPERCASPQHPPVSKNTLSDCQSVNDDSDCSSGSSIESRSSMASPTATTTAVHATPTKGNSHEEAYQRLSAIYNFAPLPPPLPFTPRATKPVAPAPPPRLEGGVMMAARRIQAALCPEKPKRTAWGLPVQNDAEDDNKPIPGWTDGSQAWRASVYGLAPPRDLSTGDVDEAAERAYGTYVASPHRSRGVHSTLGENKPATEAVPNRSASASSLPARVMDSSTEKMYKQYSASFTRRSESRTSLHHQSRGLSTSPTGSTRSAFAREVSLVKPGAEGRLLVPDVKMRRTNSSMSSIGGASGYSWSSAGATLSTVGSMAGKRRSPLSRQNSDVSVDTVETESEGDELEVTRAAVASVPAPSARMPPNTRSWSYDSEAFTYPVMPRRPKIEKRIEKQIVDGVEQEVEVEVEVYEPIKRLFLFGGARN
ncbi:hypothetical protein TRAPUB_8524 [Trametes pubescens]|uniref:Uncharacterized protein n=1 Tax=Trametes pubescens TaxID=154538 RepID=A0A1M2W4Y6_TRAPU|nr:hypothetical protein TRAPUB_8524 [Trametes pubescens]